MQIKNEIAHLVSLFDFVEDQMFWIKDPEGRYLHGNRTLLVNFSLSSLDELIGKTDYELSPAHLADQFVYDDKHVLAGEKIVGRVELVTSYDYSADWYLTNKVPLYDENNRIWASAGVTRKISEDSDAELLSPQLRKSVSYIQHHYDKVINNGKLAEISGLSVSAFERSFRRAFQCSPRQFIKRLRMSRASFELTNTNKPIAKVATDNGFTDQSFFTKEFKSHFQTSPKKYREEYFVDSA